MSSGHRLTAVVFCCLVVAVPSAIPSGAAGTDQTASLSTVQQDAERNATATSYPPNTTWENEQTLEAYATGGANFSARPPNATWKDCCYISRGNDSGEEPLISDAYIAIFATSPSTILHTQNGTERYGSPDGTVRTISNLRVNPPGDESTQSANRDLTRLTGETELLVNGTVVDSAPADSTNRLQYEDVSGTANLTVRMTLEATIRKTESHSTGPQNYSMTVTDSRIVRVQNLSAAPARQKLAWINQQGANESVIATTLHRPWHQVSFEGGPTVTSKWRYFTRYNQSWQSWQSWETAGNRSAVDGPTRVAPEEVHAVPVTAGPEMTQSDLETEAGNETDNPYLWLEYPDSPETAQPPLPSGVQLDRTGQSTTSDTFTIHSDTSLQGLDEYTVNGIVRGHTVNRSLDTSEPIAVRKVNLTAERLSPDGDRKRFQVRAVAREGLPVLQGRISLETPQSEFKQQLSPTTGNTMVVEMAQSESARGRMKYVPARPWWNQSRQVPVQATTAYYIPRNKLPPDHEIIWFLFSAVVASLPVVLALYGYRIMHRGKLLR